jgi:molybdopterin/thiamine biosynthesis adenylyltransferase
MPHTQALTPVERRLRLPELAGLGLVKVVLLGVGSLGSKVAIEMAKAGVGELVLIDPDRYDVNNAVRHELPTWLAGTHKTIGMALSCQHINPFCKVEWESRKIGVGQLSAVKFLRRLDGAHLVIETTGSRSVTRVAERYCRIAGVPLVTASLTRGSRGGDMVLVRSETCFDCFLLAQENGEIPKPEQGEQPLVLPVGCADPAFSGTGFDSSTLASDVARFAIRATGHTDYPALDHDWAVLNFVSEPRWQQGRLEPDPACGHHP